MTKKLSAPTQLIVDHLPERRFQQRLDQTPTQKDLPTGSVQASAAAPAAAQPRARQIQRAGRPPRSLPRVPQRIPHQVRYVIHREAQASSGSFFSRLVGLLVMAAIVFIGYSAVREWNLFGPTPAPIKKPVKPRITAVHTPLAKPSETKPTEQTPATVAPLATPEQGPTRKPLGVEAQKPTTRKTPTREPTLKPTSTFSAAPTLLPTAVPTAVATAVPTKKPTRAPDPVAGIDTMPEKKPVESSATSKPENEEGRAKFQISVSPAAEIYVNGRKVGTSNDAGASSDWIDVRTGVTKIELRRDGYQTRTEQVSLKAGERRRIGPFTLTKDGQRSSTAKYRLTLMTSAVPANVTITNAETRAVTNLILKDASQTVTLERGIYDIAIERDGDAKRRRIDLTGSVMQLTFSAEFKEGQH